MTVLVALLTWWLVRPQSIVISFDKREARFVYSSFNPFRKHKRVSLAGFTRVYCSPYYKHGGWSIHLSGSRGEHLVLARIPSPWAPSLHSDDVRSLSARIASGLQIADGGLG